MEKALKIREADTHYLSATIQPFVARSKNQQRTFDIKRSGCVDGHPEYHPEYAGHRRPITATIAFLTKLRLRRTLAIRWSIYQAKCKLLSLLMHRRLTSNTFSIFSV